MHQEKIAAKIARLNGPLLFRNGFCINEKQTVFKICPTHHLKESK
jgi:hypothetical protein